MKLGRSLSRWEILDQFLTLLRMRKQGMQRAVHRRSDEQVDIDNVGSRGMGERFHN